VLTNLLMIRLRLLPFATYLIAIAR
jgi:hypothetical protein